MGPQDSPLFELLPFLHVCDITLHLSPTSLLNFSFPSPLLASISTRLKIQQYPLALLWPSFISTFLLDYSIIPWVSMPSTCWRLSSLFLQPKLSSKLHLHTCLLDIPTGCLLRISNFKKLSKSEVLISTQTCPLLVFPILVNNTSGAQLSKLKTSRSSWIFYFSLSLPTPFQSIKEALLVLFPK